MRKLLIIFVFVITSTLLFANPFINHLRFSAPTADNQIVVRGQLDFYYDISFYHHGVNAWEYHTFAAMEENPNIYEARLPAPDTQTLKVGLRAYNDVVSETDTGVAIQPIPWENEDQPALTDLNWLVNDTEDDTTVDEPFLDITATHFTYNEDQLYFGIQNNGGGFPVSQAMWGPFYYYISLIIPNDINLSPFGLLYTVNQAGIIQPGLYKITGMEMTDIELIGEIETSIDADNNLLTLSCDWDDLYADADFNAWFDPEQAMFATVSGTGMITLAGGMQETDFTYPAMLYLDHLSMEVQENILPQISDIQTDLENGLISLTYYDENGNFPLTAQAWINDLDVIELHPQTYDFSEEVVFQSSELTDFDLDNESFIRLVFSDNNIDYVEETIYNVSNDDINITLAPVQVNNYPNPFNPETTISFSLNKPAFVQVDIYNLRGQFITNLESSSYSQGNHQLIWDASRENKKKLASGIYYVQLKIGQQVYNHKMILMK